MAGSKGVNKKKIVLTALGVGAVGTLAFFAINKTKNAESTPAETVDTTAPPKKKILSLPKKRKTTLLPSAKTTTLPAAPVSYEPFVPKDIAKSIKDAGESKDIGKAINLLQKMRSRADYMLVNAEYEHLRYWGNVSIVTDLLTNFFKDDAISQGKIRTEFLRMGLVQDKVTGKWSVPQNLTGLKIYKDIITMTDTYVIDNKRRRIAVNRNTILGEEVSRGNGMTWFKALDGTINSVPTATVRYV